MRVKQWTKNLFLFLPVFFAGKLFEAHAETRVFLGFLAFCLASSGVYAINDIRDLEQDRHHPEKRLRPLPAGQISPTQAGLLATVLLGISLLVAARLKHAFLYLIIFYVAQNIVYSWRLKHLPILDVSLVSLGFVIRILSGGVLADIRVSNWIVMMTFLLALFLSLAKRRDDVLISEISGQRTRRVVDGYNLDFLNMSMVLSAGILIVSYIMYCLSDEVVERWQTDKLYLTAFPVLLGVFRYLQLTLVQNKTSDPSRILLRDTFIQLTLGLWVVMFYLIIYRQQILVL
jgi:4-hydroxybenzoate polyprenyltransferase